jgi:hypothetical protein
MIAADLEAKCETGRCWSLFEHVETYSGIFHGLSEYNTTLVCGRRAGLGCEAASCRRGSSEGV